MKEYYKKALLLAATKPNKIPALYKLATAVKKIDVEKLKKKNDIADPPITIGMCVTYRCNLRCLMCDQWGEKGWAPKAGKNYFANEMTTDQIKAFIDEICHFRPYLQFTGGEPMVRKDIFELIKYANSRNLLTGMATNCTFLEEMAEDVVKSGLDYLYASLDGPDDVNKLLRLGKSSTTNAVKGIKALKIAREQLKSPFQSLANRKEDSITVSTLRAETGGGRVTGLKR